MARAKNQGGWQWPAGLDVFDPAEWDCREAWHLARAKACPDHAVKLREIQASTAREWLDGPAVGPGGVAFVRPSQRDN